MEKNQDIQGAKRILVSTIITVSKMFDEPKLNKSVCLIFNGMASMTAITFIVLFLLGITKWLLVIGILGCVLMTLANIVDIVPSFLDGMAKKIIKKNLRKKLKN